MNIILVFWLGETVKKCQGSTVHFLCCFQVCKRKTAFIKIPHFHSDRNFLSVSVVWKCLAQESSSHERFIVAKETSYFVRSSHYPTFIHSSGRWATQHTAKSHECWIGNGSLTRGSRRSWSLAPSPPSPAGRCSWWAATARSRSSLAWASMLMGSSRSPAWSGRPWTPGRRSARGCRQWRSWCRTAGYLARVGKGLLEKTSINPSEVSLEYLETLKKEKVKSCGSISYWNAL